MKLYEFLLHWGKKKPDSLFYRGDDFTMTWGEALKEMEEEKEWMGSHMPASSLLAIYMHRNEKQLLYFLAAEYAGMVPVLFHEYLKEEEIGALMEERQIGAILSDSPPSIPAASKRRKSLFPGRESSLSCCRLRRPHLRQQRPSQSPLPQG